MEVLFIILVLVHIPYVYSQCSTTCSCLPSSECCFQIEENKPAGTTVGFFNRSSYLWSTPNGLSSSNGFFNITGGLITTNVELDREGSYMIGGNTLMQNGYCFSFSLQTLVNGSNSPPVLVYIRVVDVNDNPPVFSSSSFSITIPESDGNSLTPPNCNGNNRNMFNMLRATDMDGAPNNIAVIYLLQDSPNFTIPNADFPCVQGIGLDRDTSPSSYSFTLVAQDPGNSSFRSTAKVTFVLSDINDNTPYFIDPATSVSVDETLMPGGVVYRFDANDIDLGANGKDGIAYSIGFNNAGKFSIDANGTLTLIDSLDAEMEDKYQLTITAMDGMFSSSIPFTVNVTDINEPGTYMVTPINVDIVEGTVHTDLLIFNVLFTDTDKTAANKANTEVTLTTTSASGKFYAVKVGTLSPGTTVFSVRLNSSLDREVDPTITITFNLTEGGTPTLYGSESVNVTVLDINDNSPTLNMTAFNVTEGEAYVIELYKYVQDRDNGANGTIARYELIDAQTSNLTSLTNEFKGKLSSSGNFTIAAGAIDRERVGDIINFLVNITDRGDPPNHSVVRFIVTVMDVNDNPPTFNFTSYTFNISENAPSESLLGRLRATDPDVTNMGPIMYSISPPSSDFSINRTTGQLYTKRSFDRETESPSMFVIVQASDGANLSSVNVSVLINDVNDHDPVFEDEDVFNVVTTLKVGGFVGHVVARDGDSSVENTVIIFDIQNSMYFSIPNNRSGNITLKSALSGTGTFTFNVSAFNPGREQNKTMITVTIIVKSADLLNMTLIVVISATGAFFAILILIVILLLVFVIRKNNKSKREFNLQKEAQRLNNMQTSILKIPAAAPTANGMAGGKSSRVTFKERVEETHYDEDISVINSTTNTIKKESVTKFDSPQLHHDEECVALSPAPLSPVSSSLSNGKPNKIGGGITVVDLEMSPRQGMNGNINGRCQYDMLSHSPPILRMPSGTAGAPRGRTAAEMMEYSQGTSSDGHTSVHDMDDESMYSDDASIVNTALSRFGSNRPDMSSYDGASSHPHMELHRHLPPISHGQHTHSSSLAQLHAYNLAQLAKSNSIETRPRYSPMLSPDHDLTPTDDTIHHTNTISTQSSIHTPSAALNHMGLSANSKHQHMNGTRNYTHPLVMPDAFPRDPPEVHRFPMGSFADYGEASTYASTELDEALGFNETEPGIISLTATDYDDDTQL